MIKSTKLNGENGQLPAEKFNPRINPWTLPAYYDLYSKTITNCPRARQLPRVAGHPHILETDKRG